MLDLSACGSISIDRLSDHQAAVKRHLVEGGHGYHCSSDYRDVIETLRNGACCGRAFMCTEKFERFWRPDHHVP